MDGERGKKKRRFDREFKISAVKMVTEGSHKASEVARGLGINANQLYLWKKQYGEQAEKAFPGKGHLTELVALRRELDDVKMERDILKKAVGIFSKPTESGFSL